MERKPTNSWVRDKITVCSPVGASLFSLPPLSIKLGRGRGGEEANKLMGETVE